jgi:hypothetical protein
MHDNKNKTHCSPSNASTNWILHKNTISRCQGNSRSGRPVVVYGAPLNLLPVITHLFSPVGLYLASSILRQPAACTLRRSRGVWGPNFTAHAIPQGRERDPYGSRYESARGRTVANDYRPVSPRQPSLARCPRSPSPCPSRSCPHIPWPR